MISHCYASACRKSPKRNQSFSNLNKGNFRISLPQRGKVAAKPTDEVFLTQSNSLIPMFRCAQLQVCLRKHCHFVVPLDVLLAKLDAACGRAPTGEGFFVQLYLLYRFFDSLRSRSVKTDRLLCITKTTDTQKERLGITDDPRKNKQIFVINRRTRKTSFARGSPRVIRE